LSILGLFFSFHSLFFPLLYFFFRNVVDLWEGLAESDVKVELGSDQTSLHNPYSGGYYPASLTFEEGKEVMSIFS
jgi:urocanate hydratase